MVRGRGRGCGKGTAETFQQLQPLATRDIATPGLFRPYLDLERQASGMRIYEPTLIPGLLQNEEYALTVLSAGQMPEDAAESVGYVESVNEHGKLIKDGTSVDQLAVTFDIVRGRAHSVDLSMDVMRKMMEGL